jgi:hypothetical protein
MDQTCKLFMVKWNEAGYALSDAEQGALMAQDQAALQAAGGRNVLVCDSAWSNEQWPYWGFEVFPDLAGHLQHVEAQKTLNWFSYVLRSATLLGTPQGEVAAHTPAQGEVYKLWMANPMPAVYAATPAQIDEMLGRVNEAGNGSSFATRAGRRSSGIAGAWRCSRTPKRFKSTRAC